jgi:hypothetical protein
MLSLIRNRTPHWRPCSPALVHAPGLALAAVPAPPPPSTTPGANDAIAWFRGVFEDTSEVGILVVGVILFVIGAIGMIWAVTQVLTNRGTVGDVAKIGLASAAGIAFGTYALTQASGII